MLRVIGIISFSLLLSVESAGAGISPAEVVKKTALTGQEIREFVRNRRFESCGERWAEVFTTDGRYFLYSNLANSQLLYRIVGNRLCVGKDICRVLYRRNGQVWAREFRGNYQRNFLMKPITIAESKCH
ncbi:exported hypothetical protein [Novosphingobium sp. 9U]|nr:exported hypothetical protein [Novosphingobium sp. 9U]